MKKLWLTFAFAVLVVAIPGATGRLTPAESPLLTFADWAVVDTVTEVATGTIAGTGVTMSGGDFDFGVTDESSPVFSSALFTPPLPTSDLVGFRVTPSGLSYAITFDAPVENPVLHIYSLASMLQFDRAVTKLSGDRDFGVSGGLVQGVINGSSDASGTLQLSGVISQIQFKAVAPATLGQGDGVFIQIGADVRSEPTPLFEGFLQPYPPPPLTTAPTFKAGSTIPLKWIYRMKSGEVVDSEAARPTLSIVGPTDCDSADGVPVSLGETAGSSGLNYHTGSRTWSFNWSTRSVTPGCYWIKVDAASPFGASAYLPISLRN